MRKLVLSALVASGLTLTGVGIYALEEQPNDAQTQQQQMEQGSEREADVQNQIRGEVTNIADHTIEVKDETGKTHSFDVTGLQKTEELQKGDKVVVMLENGKPTSIEKVESEASAEGTFESESSMTSEGQKGSEEDEIAAEGEYVVKEGDTLAEIAEEHLGSQDKWIVIARANNIENPDMIFAGQRLDIPSESEVKSYEDEKAPDTGSFEGTHDKDSQTEPMKENSQSAPNNY